MNQIEYNGEKIQFEIIKSKIKNMYIHIKNGEVIVKAPTRLKDDIIMEFVRKKSKWIYEKVKKAENKPKEEIAISKEEIKKLEKIVKESVEEYSDELKLYPNKVRIKNIKYAWGSCSSNKNISINMQLVKKEEKVIKYVVLHEMCHLKYMNHSKEFWNLIEKHMPDYKVYKNKLKD